MDANIDVGRQVKPREKTIRITEPLRRYHSLLWERMIWMYVCLQDIYFPGLLDSLGRQRKTEAEIVTCLYMIFEC